MIELGTLVRSVDDGCIGIVTWCDDPNNDLVPSDRVYKVAWADGLQTLHYADEVEIMTQRTKTVHPTCGTQMDSL